MGGGGEEIKNKKLIARARLSLIETEPLIVTKRFPLIATEISPSLATDRSSPHRYPEEDYLSLQPKDYIATERLSPHRYG